MGCSNDISIEVDNRVKRKSNNNNNEEYSSEHDDVQDFEEYESK